MKKKHFKLSNYNSLVHEFWIYLMKLQHNFWWFSNIKLNKFLWFCWSDHLINIYHSITKYLKSIWFCNIYIQFIKFKIKNNSWYINMNSFIFFYRTFFKSYIILVHKMWYEKKQNFLHSKNNVWMSMCLIYIGK